MADESNLKCGDIINLSLYHSTTNSMDKKIKFLLSSRKFFFFHISILVLTFFLANILQFHLTYNLVEGKLGILLGDKGMAIYPIINKYIIEHLM